MVNFPAEGQAHPRRDPESIRAEAAAWIARRDRGLTPAQETEFSLWLEADPLHVAAFATLAETWDRLDGLRALQPAGGIDSDPDFSPASSIGWRRASLVAAAAALALGIGLWTWKHGSPGEARSIATAIGEQKQFNLTDGSVIDMNTDSAAEVRYSPAERDVRLVRGEANFTVAKNAARPFVVTAGGVTVRAVGTAFNVRLGPEAIEVLVTEGKVRVDDAVRGGSLLPPADAAQPRLLVAGERAVIPMPEGAQAKEASVAPLQPAEISRALAWEERRLDFGQESPLSLVVAEFNRYNSHKLVIADPAIESLRIGGAFRADNYDGFVRLLESNFGIEAERRDSETLLRKAK